MDYFENFIKITFMSKLILYKCLLMAVIISQGDTTLTVYTSEACYGTTGNNTLSPACSSGESVYTYDAYTYAKLSSSAATYGCVTQRTNLIISYDEANCCTYISSDCGMRYYGSFTHYCVGVQSCDILVEQNSTSGTCDQSTYFSDTNYMKAFYNCISNSLITSICDSASLSGNNRLYIWSPGYPGKGPDCTTSSGCSCSVSASGGSTIKVNILDVRIHDYANSDCYQRLHITDGSSEAEITCTDFNAFERRTAYTSTSSSITIRYDNTFTGAIGNFWIELEGVNGGSTLTMTCGTGTVVFNCNDNLTSVQSSSGDVSTTSQSVINSTNTDEGYTQAELAGMVCGVVIGAGLLWRFVIQIILTLVLEKCGTHYNNKVCQGSEQIPIQEFGQESKADVEISSPPNNNKLNPNSAKSPRSAWN